LVAVRKIHDINTKPYKLWLRTLAEHIAFAASGYVIVTSHMLDAN
jgi:hypothetical protein